MGWSAGAAPSQSPDRTEAAMAWTASSARALSACPPSTPATVRSESSSPTMSVPTPGSLGTAGIHSHFPPPRLPSEQIGTDVSLCEPPAARVCDVNVQQHLDRGTIVHLVHMEHASLPESLASQQRSLHRQQQYQQHQQSQQEQQRRRQDLFEMVPLTSNTPASCSSSASSSASSLSLDDLDQGSNCGASLEAKAHAPRSPILPVRVDLVNVGYSTEQARARQAPILRDVNACFQPGHLVAVMGPSGSGKSTLLRLVQGDHRYLRRIQGQVLANGTPVKAIHRAWRYLCSLVPQEDVLLGSFTVRETMRFSTQLRLPHDRPAEEKEAVVRDVLEDLGIMECQDVLVKDISGGQRRRVSVGLELLVNPSVLLLDEPTSGLDSKTAEDICALLKALAKPGRVVMCSIHQPSFKIFSSFSKLCFLVKGSLAYAGSVPDVMPYFAARGFRVPTYDSPADYYMRVMQTEGPALIAAWADAAPLREPPSPPHVADAADTASASAESDCIPSIRTAISTPFAALATDGGEAGASVKDPPSLVAWDPTGSWLRSADAQDGRRAAHVSNWQQYRVLLRRFWEDSYKDKGKMMSGVAMEGSIGLLVGLVWFQQDIHEKGSVFPIMGVFIMLTTIAIFDNCVSVGLKFPLTRALHFREFSNGYYRLLPYYLATVTSSLILASIYQLLQALLVFFLVGLHFTVGKFLVYLFVLALAASMGAFLGFIVGTYTSDLKRTQEVLTPLLMPMIIFSGYMLPLPQIPTYLRFMYYSSFYQYVFSALAINHFSGLEFTDCSPLNSFCLSKGDQYLALVGLAPSMLARNLVICVGFLLLLIGLGFMGLRRVSL